MSIVIKQRNNENKTPGFENVGFNLHPDCVSSIPIPFVNGKFQLGLDNQPELKKYFEEGLGVTFDSEAGQEFLNEFYIDVDHAETILNDSVLSKFKLHLIKTHNGFGMIKYGDATSGPVDTFLFEVVDEKADTEQRVTKKITLATAQAKLLDMWENKRHKLLLFAKYTFSEQSGIENDTAAYDKLSNFIQEIGNAKTFLRNLEVPDEQMDLDVTIKTAIAKNIIRYQDGRYVNHVNGTPLGRNFEEISIYLANPVNQDELGDGSDTDKPYTIKAQLKNSLR